MAQPERTRWFTRTWFIILTLVIFAPAGIALLWLKRPLWPRNLKIALTVLGAAIFLPAMFSRPGPSRVDPTPTIVPIATATATVARSLPPTPAPTLVPTIAPTATIPPATAAPTAEPPPPPPATAAPAKPAPTAAPAKPTGRAAPQGNSCPDGFKIKGNQTGREKIYHVPTGASYARTDPEECFATEADAQVAGYRRAQN